MLIEPTENKTDPKRKCFIYSKNSKRKDTRYVCEECNVGLCAVPCFSLNHIKRFVAENNRKCFVYYQ